MQFRLKSGQISSVLNVDLATKYNKVVLCPIVIVHYPDKKFGGKRNESKRLTARIMFVSTAVHFIVVNSHEFRAVSGVQPLVHEDSDNIMDVINHISGIDSAIF